MHWQMPLPASNPYARIQARYTEDPIRAHNCHTRFISIYFHMHCASRGKTTVEPEKKSSVDIFAAAARLTDGYYRRTRVDAFVSNIQFSLSSTQIGCIFPCRSGCTSTWNRPAHWHYSMVTQISSVCPCTQSAYKIPKNWFKFNYSVVVFYSLLSHHIVRATHLSRNLCRYFISHATSMHINSGHSPVR